MASIVKKKRTYFYISFSEQQPDGSKKRRTLYAGKAEKEAQFKLMEIELAIERGREIPKASRRNRKISDGLHCLITRFQNQLDASVAQSTKELYVRGLKRFKAFIGGDKPISQVKPSELEAYKVTRNGAAYDTIRNDFVVLKAFFSWLNRMEIYDQNPARKIRVRKPEQNKPPDFLTQKEIKALLKAAKPRPRDFALFTVMLNTGVRSAELCGLRWDAVDLKHGRLTVKGKGSKYRTIPITLDCKKALSSRPKDQPYVFITAALKPFNRHSIRMLFDRYSKWTGRKVHPHLLRHTFATHFMMSCGNPVLVKEILGHSSITTTMIYAHVNQEMLSGAMEGLWKP